MTFPTKLMCSGVALLALAACGGGDDDDVLNNNFSSLQAGSVARALDDGAQFSAGHAAVIAIDFDGDTTALADESFELRKTADGNLAMTVDGREFIFTDADQDFPFGYDFNDGTDFYSLYSQDGEITDELDPSNRRYAAVLGYFVDEASTFGGTTGYVVIGTETELAQLGLLSGETTYNGFVNADFWASAGFDDFDQDRVRVRGDMELVADFTDNTISGQSAPGALTIREGGNPETGMTGTLFYDATTIDGTSFAGSVSVDGDFLTSTGVGTVSGDYEGSFYGPFADEAAGVLSGTTAGGFNMVGQFNSRAQN